MPQRARHFAPRAGTPSARTAGLVIGVFMSTFGAAAFASPSLIDDDVARCQQDPRFIVGGAAIGDCLLEISETVDTEISARLTEGAARYCLDEDRSDYLRSQEDWEVYRTRLCDLVQRSPDNTPSWINGAACRLELGRQRLTSLIYTNEYGNARCAPGMRPPP